MTLPVAIVEVDMNIDRGFLDELYQFRYIAVDQISELKEVNTFDGSEGSCHQETHEIKIAVKKDQLAVIDNLIDAYLKSHS